MSDHGSDGGVETGAERSATPALCTACGDAIDRREWHPVATEIGDGGELRIYPFCDESCREAWEDD